MSAQLRWYDDEEVRAILAEPLFYPDADDEARTDALIAEAVQLDLQALEEWIESRDRADPFLSAEGE